MTKDTGNDRVEVHKLFTAIDLAISYVEGKQSPSSHTLHETFIQNTDHSAENHSSNTHSYTYNPFPFIYLQKA